MVLIVKPQKDTSLLTYVAGCFILLWIVRTTVSELQTERHLILALWSEKLYCSTGYCNNEYNPDFY